MMFNLSGQDRKSTTICLILIFILGLIPLFYFRDGLIVTGGDEGYQLLSPNFQLSNSYVWDVVHGSGYYNPTYPMLVSYLIPLSFLNVIKVPLFISDALLLSFLFMSAGLSMYFLASSLSNRKNNLVAVSSAIFYMFNAYNLLWWSSPDFVVLSAYAMYPLMFALFVRGIKSKKYLINGTLFALGSLIFTAGNGRFMFSVIMFFTLFCYFMFHLTSSKDSKEKICAIRFTFVAAILYLLVNLWWILPLLNSYEEQVNIRAGMNPGDWLRGFSSYSSILHLFQFYGYPGWESYNWGRPSFSYVPTLVNNPFFIFLSFLPPLLLGVALILQSKAKIQIRDQKGIFLFFSLLYFLSIFLAKGTQPPFGDFYYWLFDHIPALTMFRSGFVNFGIMMALSLAILFGASLGVLYQRFRSVRINSLRKWHIEKVMVVTLISLILIQNYPFFTGEVIHSGEGALPSFHHNIPDYYYEAGNWFKDQNGDFRIFSPSFSGQGWVIYNFGGGDIYVGCDIDSYLMQKPIVFYESNPLASAIFPLLLNNRTEYIGKQLNLLNVKYVILHHDVDLSLYGGISPEAIKASLLLQKDICLEKTFGKIEIYLNTDYKEMSIYATNQLQLNENLTTMFSEIDKGYVDQAQLLITPSGEGAMDYTSNITDIKITFVPKHRYITGFELPLSFMFNPTDDVVIELYDDSDTLLGTDIIPRSKITSNINTEPSWCFADIPQQHDTSKTYYLRIHSSNEEYSTTKNFLVSLNTNYDLLPDGAFYRYEAGSWIPKGSPVIKIYYSNYTNQGDIIFFLTEQLNENEIRNIETLELNTLYQPDISFQKLNPTKYIVHANASTPFSLILSESYHKDWVAYVDGQQVPDEYHFTANGYANGWYINKTGMFTITLEFWSQNLFYIGSAISIVTLILCILFVSKDKIKIMYQKYVKNKQVS
jgi:hypothetical protein